MKTFLLLLGGGLLCAGLPAAAFAARLPGARLSAKQGGQAQAGPAPGGVPNEFKIKRREVFEFTEKPRIARSGDRVEIAFAAKGFCDVTVAVEDAGGKIVRHLACGVLGANVPEPLLKNSLAQTLVWDGKDDQGRYIDDKNSLRVRVSLGLKPYFEKNLLWEPKRRTGAGRAVGPSSFANLPAPLVRAAPEGVYVFEGWGVDHLRLFSHEGAYIRTIHPFPADQMDKVRGLTWQTALQDGRRTPLKAGFLQSTFLTSGASSEMQSYYTAMFGGAATAMAVRDGRIALAMFRLNRLASDGSTGGLPLEGPKIGIPVTLSGGNRGTATVAINPMSAAFSPDAKWLYLAGFMWRDGNPGQSLLKGGLHVVMRVAYEGDVPPEIFAGDPKPDASGGDDGHFTDPTSVDCDSQGRVYVSDFMNDRIQVYDTAGAPGRSPLLKTIPVFKPALVRVHQRTGEIYVFSWAVSNDMTLGRASQGKDILIPPILTRLKSFEDPRTVGTHPLKPLGVGDEKYSMWSRWGGLQYQFELDSWTDPPTLWFANGSPDALDRDLAAGNLERDNPAGRWWDSKGVKLYAIKGGQLVLQRDFSEEVKRSIARTAPPFFWRQRLYVNPANRKLYVAEGETAWNKAFYDMLEVDPETGSVRVIPLPFDTEDLAFDMEGMAYLRTRRLMARYDAGTWREVPFDYGEERTGVGTGKSTPNGYTRADVLSGIPTYGVWHTGGMYVSPKGYIAVCNNLTKGDYVPPVARRTDEKQADFAHTYLPRVFPGRIRFVEIHVWDKHGKMVYDDAVPGLVEGYGVGMDKDDNIYFMSPLIRIIDGKRYPNPLTGTLLKFKPKAGRVLSSANGPLVTIPLPEESWPKREPDFFKKMTGNAWAENAEWMYGGVGFCGKNAPYAGGGCACWNTRFALDYFARSFVPEVDHYSVAVLDANGNLILRVGRYGNVDSSGPSSRAPLGGDEVGLMYAPYVAVDTDRRLFIADGGNARIASVKLDYHAAVTVPLAGVSDAVKGLDR